MIRLTIAVPCLGGVARLKSCVASLVTSLSFPEATELLLLDQDPEDCWGPWAKEYLTRKVGLVNVINSRHNVGLPLAHSMLQAAAASTSTVIAYFHNDVLIYERGWDDRVLSLFDENDKIGVVGFAGARGIGANGSRNEFWSNMLEAEIHGSRGDGVLPVAMLDGFSLICSRAMLREAGWDCKYPIHHYYDYDICTAAHLAGWRNLLCGVSCHHLSGITNSFPKYNQQADALTGAGPGQGGFVLLEQARQRYLSKFRGHLPLFVNDWYN